MTDKGVQAGDRFESEDERDEGRVVKVLGPAVPIATDDGPEWLVETVAHPKNPDAVGNVSRVSEFTLNDRYRRVSR